MPYVTPTLTEPIKVCMYRPLGTTCLHRLPFLSPGQEHHSKVLGLTSKSKNKTNNNKSLSHHPSSQVWVSSLQGRWATRYITCSDVASQLPEPRFFPWGATECFAWSVVIPSVCLTNFSFLKPSFSGYCSLACRIGSSGVQGNLGR